MEDELHADDKPVRNSGNKFGWPDDGRSERMPAWFVELRDELMNKLCSMHDDMSSETFANKLTYDVEAHVEMVEQENKLAAEFPAQWREWYMIRFQMMKLAERLQEIR
jgi:hypothetical protein